MPSKAPWKIRLRMFLYILLLAPIFAQPSTEESEDWDSDDLDIFQETVGDRCSKQSDCGFLPGLACIDGKCDFCRVDKDCGVSIYDYSKRCQVLSEIDPHTGKETVLLGKSSTGEHVKASYCIEKDLFSPFTITDVIATLIAFTSVALGSGCGVGGGGLLVPLYIFVVGLSPKHAIPLSKATIFGNAIATFLFNLGRKHPNKPNVPIINYAMAAIMEPPTLIGALFGVMMNHVFPNWLILSLLLTLLSYITYRTFVKGNKLRAKETHRRIQLMKKPLKGRSHGGGRGRLWSIYRQFDATIAAKRWLAITRRNKKKRETLFQDQEDFKNLPPLNIPLQQKTKFGTFQLLEESFADITCSKLERRDTQQFPIRYILVLLVSWLIILLQAFLRGGHGNPSFVGIKCASVSYWLVTFLPLSILIGITLWVGYQLRLENRLRVISEYPFMEGDIHWTKPRVLKFPSLCTIAGIAAGLLGIGGGMVKGPIMLEMGILPPVQSATASFMILFTSSSTTIQFAIAGQFPGQLQYDYVIWYILVGFLGGLTGNHLVSMLVKKYNRESIMVYILGVTIGLSAISMGIVGFKNVKHDLRHGVHLGFSSMCGNE